MTIQDLDEVATPLTFEDIVAGWSINLHCAGTKTAACSRPARWKLDIHGCEVVLLCGHHVRAWERKAATDMDPVCELCGGQWPSIADAYRVLPL